MKDDGCHGDDRRYEPPESGLKERQVMSKEGEQAIEMGRGCPGRWQSTQQIKDGTDADDCDNEAAGTSGKMQAGIENSRSDHDDGDRIEHTQYRN